MRYFLILITLLLFQVTFAQDEYKTVFSENFSSNKNGWHIENTSLRNSQIANGKLIDWSGEDGFSYSNVVSADFNKNQDYIIKFSIANLNNQKGYKYKVYTKKSNGSLKEGWQKNPVWGFVWGFKDWNNYNAILLVNAIKYSYDTYGETHVKVISVVNGNTMVHQDWYSPTIGLSNFTATNEFTIEKIGNEYRICTQNGYEQYICRFSGTSWAGNYLGALIGSGSKIVLDYIKIDVATPCKEAKYIISQGDKFVEQQYYANAIEKYSEAIKLGCISAELYYKRAEANFHREFYASAKDDCSEAISMSYNNEKAYYLRGLCKIYLNDETAISDLEKGGEEGKMLIKEIESQIITQGESPAISKFGSGLIISKSGYIVTNDHVIEGGNEISVELSRNGKKQIYKTIIVKTDKTNDLAILKIKDENFRSYSNIPYGIKSFGVRVGESVFSMGYPQINLQGEEIKVTDGIISSKTGFQNDVTTYQISAPIQPGNSGGPLFDKQGNLIGITNAGIPDAENVGYAIKSSYLMSMLELINDIDLNYSNSISSLSFPDLIEKLSDYVVLIKVESGSKTSVSAQSDNSTSVIKGGYSSSPLTDFVWDYSKKDYVQASINNSTSKLYFTPDLLYFKRGSNAWKMNKWSYEGFNSSDNYHYFYDNYGQQILINKDFTKVIWYYDRDGEIFKSCSVYDNLKKDSSIYPE